MPRTVVGTAAYEIDEVENGPRYRALFPGRRSFILTGPRGATYYVVSDGPKFSPRVVAMQGTAKRQIAGLCHEHLTGGLAQ